VRLISGRGRRNAAGPRRTEEDRVSHPAANASDDLRRMLRDPALTTSVLVLWSCWGVHPLPARLAAPSDVHRGGGAPRWGISSHPQGSHPPPSFWNTCSWRALVGPPGTGLGLLRLHRSADNGKVGGLTRSSSPRGPAAFRRPRPLDQPHCAGSTSLIQRSTNSLPVGPRQKARRWEDLPTFRTSARLGSIFHIGWAG